MKSINYKIYDYFNEKAGSVLGKTVLALWSFAEASFWFIAPDFLLIILGASRPEKWKAFTRHAVLYSFLGGIFYYALCSLAPEWSASVLQHTPFVNESMISFIESTYTKYGHGGVFFQAFSFMSFKIWTFLAVKVQFNPWIYFAIVMVSRTLRLGLVSWLASIVGRKFKSQIARYYVSLLVIYSILFVTMLIYIES